MRPFMSYRFENNEFGEDRNKNNYFLDKERKGLIKKHAFFYEYFGEAPVCPYCNEHIDYKHAAVDHIIPFKMYVRYHLLKNISIDIDAFLDDGIYNLENFCLCCASCNSSKGNSLATEKITKAIVNFSAAGVDPGIFNKALMIANDILETLPGYQAIYCMKGIYWQPDVSLLKPEVLGDELKRRDKWMSSFTGGKEVNLNDAVLWLSEKISDNLDPPPHPALIRRHLVKIKKYEVGKVEFTALVSVRKPADAESKNKISKVPIDPGDPGQVKYRTEVQFSGLSRAYVLRTVEGLLMNTPKEQKTIIEEESQSESEAGTMVPENVSSLLSDPAEDCTDHDEDDDDDDDDDDDEYLHDLDSRGRKNKDITDVKPEKPLPLQKKNVGDPYLKGKNLREALMLKQVFKKEQSLPVLCCCYCLGFYPSSSFQIDHIDSGLKKRSYHLSNNLLAVCQGCNNNKRENRLTTDFLNKRIEDRQNSDRKTGLENKITKSSLYNYTPMVIATCMQAYVLREHIKTSRGSLDVNYIAACFEILKKTQMEFSLPKNFTENYEKFKQR